MFDLLFTLNCRRIVTYNSCLKLNVNARKVTEHELKIRLEDKKCEHNEVTYVRRPASEHTMKKISILKKNTFLIKLRKFVRKLHEVTHRELCHRKVSYFICRVVFISFVKL